MAAKLRKIRDIKAKDSPWDADLTGSVASTVGTKVHNYLINIILITF